MKTEEKRKNTKGRDEKANETSKLIQKLELMLQFVIVSFKTIPLMSFCPSKGLFTRALVLTPLNKMGLPSEKIIVWKEPVSLCCLLPCFLICEQYCNLSH